MPCGTAWPRWVLGCCNSHGEGAAGCSGGACFRNSSASEDPSINLLQRVRPCLVRRCLVRTKYSHNLCPASCSTILNAHLTQHRLLSLWRACSASSCDHCPDCRSTHSTGAPSTAHPARSQQQLKAWLASSAAVSRATVEGLSGFAAARQTAGQR